MHHSRSNKNEKKKVLVFKTQANMTSSISRVSKDKEDNREEKEGQHSSKANETSGEEVV